MCENASNNGSDSHLHEDARDHLLTRRAEHIEIDIDIPTKALAHWDIGWPAALTVLIRCYVFDQNHEF